MSHPWRSSCWFAIHAKTRGESFAAASVRNLGAETFLPETCEDRRIRRCWRKVVIPLFPGYFFAYFSPELLLTAIQHARGVLSVVSAGMTPTIVDDQIIEGLRMHVGNDGYIKFSEPTLDPGDRVKIGAGPFAGCVGRIVMECDDRKRVALLLEAVLGGRIFIERQYLSVAVV